MYPAQKGWCLCSSPPKLHRRPPMYNSHASPILEPHQETQSPRRLALCQRQSQTALCSPSILRKARWDPHRSQRSGQRGQGVTLSVDECEKPQIGRCRCPHVVGTVQVVFPRCCCALNSLSAVLHHFVLVSCGEFARFVAKW
jgi:hypothetical protein